MHLFEPLTPFIQFPTLPGYEVHYNELLKGFQAIFPQGELFYAPQFFSQSYSEKMIQFLLENEQGDWRKTNWDTIQKEQLTQFPFKNIEWSQDVLTMYGKKVYAPRFSAWYGDEGKSYGYSGLKLQANPWNEGLLSIKNEIEKIYPAKYNSVLLNWYRKGSDYMGWHTDDEPELGRNPIIASVNFGAERRFLFRKKNQPREKIEIILQNGSLLIMSGEIQHYWQHALPKSAKVAGHRINLTFRNIL